MIPKNITREHVLNALQEIDKNRIPKRRGSTKFKLGFNEKNYPPKYVMSLANKYANGEELDSQDFSGGREANNYLEQLGFAIKPLNSRKRKSQSGASRPRWETKVEEESNPSLARIVIAGEWNGDVKTSKQLLKEVCDKWPKDKKVHCLITCGAFLNFDWPQSLINVGDNKNPDETVLKLLISKAEKQCCLLLDDELRGKLSDCTDYITIGIDSQKDKRSPSDVSIRTLHVELVALVNLNKNQYFWTGKSLPTNGQENDLVRVADLSTHFSEWSSGEVMILGCHDLNLLIDRGKKTGSMTWRKSIKEEFQEMAREESPKYILQHPHTTDSIRSWSAAWGATEKLLGKSLKKYVSAGRYYNCANPGHERSKLDDVLNKTRSGETIDFIISIKKE